MNELKKRRFLAIYNNNHVHEDVNEIDSQSDMEQDLLFLRILIDQVKAPDELEDEFFNWLYFVVKSIESS